MCGSSPPAEVVKKLSSRFYVREDTNPYFTMTYGLVDTGSGRVRLVRAGHPFPLLHKADGSVRLVKTEGYAVGLFPGAEVASEDVQLERGDRLFLYSDGLMDCTNPAGASFGARRLEDAVKAGRDLRLTDVVASIRKELVAWRGSESFADDVSLLVVERD